jgi:NAD(P)-dependent dehydrogenase (short-subunit alcohol dehydrogenase family)
MQTSRRFDDQVALVTGSSRGLGRALALRLAAEGASVIVNSALTPVDGAGVAAEIKRTGGRAIYVRANMASEVELEALAELVRSRFGRIEIVIHNAAGGCECRADEIAWPDFERTFRTNTYALVVLARTLAPLMRDRGKMLYVSSFGALRAVPGYALVGASKAASEAIVRSLALELAPRIQVNTLRPSIMSTVSLRAFSLGEKFLELAATESPLGPARLEDLVNAALFLCSSDADYITGQTLDVDGGMSSSIFRSEWVGNGATAHEESCNVG